MDAVDLIAGGKTATWLSDSTLVTVNALTPTTHDLAERVLLSLKATGFTQSVVFSFVLPSPPVLDRRSSPDYALQWTVSRGEDDAIEPAPHAARFPLDPFLHRDENRSPTHRLLRSHRSLLQRENDPEPARFPLDDVQGNSF